MRGTTQHLRLHLEAALLSSPSSGELITTCDSSRDVRCLRGGCLCTRGSSSRPGHTGPFQALRHPGVCPSTRDASWGPPCGGGGLSTRAGDLQACASPGRSPGLGLPGAEAERRFGKAPTSTRVGFKNLHQIKMSCGLSPPGQPL